MSQQTDRPRNPILRLFLPPYSRTDVFQILTIVALIVVAGVVFFRSPISPTAGPDAVYVKAAAITQDNRDITLKVEQHSHKAQIQAVKPPLAAGETAPSAPLMDWENDDVRYGTVMTWCLTGMASDADSQQVVRDTLNQLHNAFPDNVKWQEGCPGSYTVGMDSDLDCGTSGTVACAATYGPRSGHVSINGGLIAATQLLHKGKVVALGHEMQHIILNLGHNNCGTVLDPVTGKPVASAMTPIILPNGPSCSNPGATGLNPCDWFYAYAYYHLPAPRLAAGQSCSASGGSDPGSTPTASPVPSPSPTPAPTPVPRPAAAVIAERWVPSTAGCQGQVIGDWCYYAARLPSGTSGDVYRFDATDGLGTYTPLGDPVYIP